MSSTPTLALIASACLALAAAQGPKPEDTNARLAAVEQELAGQKKANEKLAKDVAELREAAERTVRYLEAQSKAAETMAATLDESEKAGFTYGINPESRHVLLRGWREALAAAQKDVPALKLTAAKPAGPQ